MSEPLQIRTPTKQIYNFISYEDKQIRYPRCGCDGKVCWSLAEELGDLFNTWRPDSYESKKNFTIWLSTLDKENVISFLERLLVDSTIDNNIKEKLKEFLDKIRRHYCNNCGHRGCNGC